MYYQIKKLTSCFVLALSTVIYIPQFVWGEPKVILGGGMDSGGGGGAFVCRDGGFGSGTEIVSSELLDLWEAVNIHGWPITYSNAPVEEQIHNALEKFNDYYPMLKEDLRVELDYLMQNIRVLPPNVIIMPPQDAHNLYGKRGCPLEGMMYYNGTVQKLNIDKLIFDKLQTKTDVAAAYLHEAIYKLFRNIPDYHTNSIGTRILIGCLFSTSNQCFKKRSIDEALADIKNYLHCKGRDVEYFRYNPNSFDQETAVTITKRIGSFEFKYANNFWLSHKSHNPSPIDPPYLARITYDDFAVFGFPLYYVGGNKLYDYRQRELTRYLDSDATCTSVRR